MTLDTRRLPTEISINKPISQVISNLYRLRVPQVEFVKRTEDEANHADFARPGNYAATQFMQRSCFPFYKWTFNVWVIAGRLQPGVHANETVLSIEVIELPLARALFRLVTALVVLGLIASTVVSGNPIFLLGGLVPLMLIGVGYFFVQNGMRLILARQTKILANAARGQFP